MLHPFILPLWELNVSSYPSDPSGLPRGVISSLFPVMCNCVNRFCKSYTCRVVFYVYLCCVKVFYMDNHIYSNKKTNRRALNVLGKSKITKGY